MATYFRLIFPGLFYLLAIQASSQEFSYPVDIARHEASGKFYISNWGDGNGNIVVMDSAGNIESYLTQNLGYAGGLCIVNDILYVVSNTGLYNSGLPCYLDGIDLNSGSQILHVQIAANNAYLDKVIPGKGGKLYISDSGLGKIYSYDLGSGNIATITSPGNSNFLYSICYDDYDDRIVFTYSTFTSSFIKSVSPEGGEITNLAFYNGFLENIIREADGDFYVSSWGNDYSWGNEYIFRYNHTFTESITATTGLNRPFGMFRKEITNELIVCNWGSHTVDFIDLTPIGISEPLTGETIQIFPLPASEFINIKIPDGFVLNSSVTITGIYGQKILDNGIHSTNENNLRVDVSSLPEGVYIAELNHNNHKYRSKFVVKR